MKRCVTCGRFMGDTCRRCVEPIVTIASGIVSMGLITTLVTGGGVSECLARIRSLWSDVVVGMDHRVATAEAELGGSAAHEVPAEGSRVHPRADSSGRNSADDVL